MIILTMVGYNLVGLWPPFVVGPTCDDRCFVLQSGSTGAESSFVWKVICQEQKHCHKQSQGQSDGAEENKEKQNHFDANAACARWRQSSVSPSNPT